MIYVDQIFDANPLWHAVENAMARQAARHGTRWCHLWCWPDTAENRERLHAIAKAIGLRREYFQDRKRADGIGFPHYDLVPGKRKLALEHGAVEKELRDWIMETRGSGESRVAGGGGAGGGDVEKQEVQATLF